MLCFTRPGASALEEGMDENTHEAAYFDYLEARERALDAAAGHFMVANVSSEHLRIIAKSTTDQNIALAARIVLWNRGDDQSITDTPQSRSESSDT